MIAGILAYPWVLNLTARAALAAAGGGVEESEAGYRGHRWQGIHWRNDLVEVSVASLELGSIADYFRQLGSREEPFLWGQGVRIIVGEPEESEEAVNIPELLDTIRSAIAVLEDWLPPVQVTSIELELAPELVPQAEGRPLVVESLRWDGRRLRLNELDLAGLLPEGSDLGAEAALESVEAWREAAGLRLMAQHREGAVLRARLSSEAGAGVAGLEGSLSWEGGQGTLSAGFGIHGPVPRRASFEATFSGLPTFIPGVAEARPSGELSAAFDGEAMAYRVALRAEGAGIGIAAADAGWQASVEAGGDRDSVVLEQLDVTIPGIRARLSSPVEVDLESLEPREAAALFWSVDLAEAGVPDAAGRLEGSLGVRPHPRREGADFRLKGTAAEIAFPMGEAVQALPMQANFRLDGWANSQGFVIEAFQLEGEGLGEVAGAVAWSREESAAHRLELQGHLHRDLLDLVVEQEGLELEDAVVRFELAAEHRPEGWEHRGRVEPLAFRIGDVWGARAQLDWAGLDGALERWELQVDRPEVGLRALGSLRKGDEIWSIEVLELAEHRPEGEGWVLVEPFLAELRAGETMAAASSRIHLKRGNGGMIDLSGRWENWNQRRLQVTLQGLSREDLLPWLDRPVPLFEITALEAELRSGGQAADAFRWEAGLRFEAGWTSARGRLWSVAGGVVLDEGIRFDQIDFITDGVRWVSLRGSLPVEIGGSRGEAFQWRANEEGELALDLRVEPIEFLPQPLEERLPLRLQGVEGSLEAFGSLRDPEAQLSLRVRELEWPDEENETDLRFNDFVMAAGVANDRINLSEVSIRLPGADEASSLSALVEGIEWSQWVDEASLERLMDLSGRVDVRRWPVAALGRFLPEMVEPGGQVTVAVEKERDAWPSGEISWQGIALRPIGTGLATRDVQGRTLLQGRRLEDLELSATVGGRPLRVTGWAEFEDFRNPLFEFQLDAERLDLVRQADMILRARADLTASRTEAEASPLISGEIKLFDSVWLRDLAAFTQQSASGVSRRPPYFSVNMEPWANWRLDVRLSGDDFLQVRTPVMTGLVSADFDLHGRLGDPLLIGSAWVPSGALVFPFARLPVNELRARITTEAPHILQLSGGGEGITYGYSVMFQLAGTADEPSLTFSAVPSLSQDAIILMLATGAVPTNDMGADATQRAGRLALYLGQDIFSDLLGSGGGASRLEVRSGEGFSPFRRGGQVIEYRLNEDWSLLGEYDDFGGYNVDLKRMLIRR